MNNNHLHIISFDVPYPADYGGVVDVFFKLKAIALCGVKIILHCYEYGRPHSDELNKYCEEVNYYPRKISKGKFFGRLPYIVSSRASQKLLERLLNDNYPILMEGLHSTFFLNNELLKNRIKIVRTHNIEHEYYRHLASKETHIFKRSYYNNAALKLNYYEPVLKNAQLIAAISPADTHYFQNKYGNTFYLPAFHPNENVVCRPGRGGFAFYHGNLNVAENNEAALFLVNEVFSKTQHPFIISGSKPSRELQKAAILHSNIELRAADSPDKILLLIAEAHINILPTFQSTGIKLKLITALFRGRFCIVNTPMIKATGLDTLCIVNDSADLMIKSLDEYFSTEFTTEDLKKRKAMLEKSFSNNSNAKILVQVISDLHSKT